MDTLAWTDGHSCRAQLYAPYGEGIKNDQKCDSSYAVVLCVYYLLDIHDTNMTTSN